MLSSSARIDKSKRKSKPIVRPPASITKTLSIQEVQDDGQESDRSASGDERKQASSKKRKKKHHSDKKLELIHKEEVAAFRRRVGIKLSSDNRHDGGVPDPISSFRDWTCPKWWGGSAGGDGDKSSNKPHPVFHKVHQTILHNIENGKWMEPTPIQMQAIPSLMDLRDVMACAPTGSGKTGAFVLPAIMLSKCPEEIFYGKDQAATSSVADSSINTKKNPKNKNEKQQPPNQTNQQGSVRTLLLTPSRELSSQIHREVLRLTSNTPHKFHCALLSKSNAGLAAQNKLGGNSGLDCLIATPMRLVECIERGMRLSGLRLIVLDEADRLLDASDGRREREKVVAEGDEEEESDDDGDGCKEGKNEKQSGSFQSRTFLQQIDSILAHLPSSATRALFSATLGPSVRHLSESILRSPIDITTGIHAGIGGNSAAGGASEHIRQELKFVGREDGKLLAIRQLVAEGITPPVLIFLQSKERAQALFGELLYDGIRVDVIHAGRSVAAREASVAKFRRGDTWVLICTDLVARGVDFKAVNLVINYDLPLEGVTYVHRIGRTGRAGRQGRAITFFTESDFDNLRTIANVMRLSGCEVPEWMLQLKRQTKTSKGGGQEKKRGNIDTTPVYDKKKMKKRKQSIQYSKQKKADKQAEEC